MACSMQSTSRQSRLVASNEKFRSLQRDRGQTLLPTPIHAGILILTVIVLQHNDVMSKT